MSMEIEREREKGGPYQRTEQPIREGEGRTNVAGSWLRTPNEFECSLPLSPLFATCFLFPFLSSSLGILPSFCLPFYKVVLIIIDVSLEREKKTSGGELHPVYGGMGVGIA